MVDINALRKKNIVQGLVEIVKTLKWFHGLLFQKLF